MCSFDSFVFEIFPKLYHVQEAWDNLIDAKCKWRSDRLDDAGSNRELLGQKKVMQIHQRTITHEICSLAAQSAESLLRKRLFSWADNWVQLYHRTPQAQPAWACLVRPALDLDFGRANMHHLALTKGNFLVSVWFQNCCFPSVIFDKDCSDYSLKPNALSLHFWRQKRGTMKYLF